MNRGLLVGVQRLHQVDFHRKGSLAQRTDVLVDVLAFAHEGAFDGETQHVHPQRLQALLVGPADGNLLDAENAKRLAVHQAKLKMG